MSRRLGVGPDVRPGAYFPAYFGNSVQAVDRHPAVINRAQTIKFTLAVYFPAYPGNSAPAVWPQNSPGSAVGVREIFGDDTFGDPADNRSVEPAG
jgi:hypothetical protein